ncbi:MAG: hypothetical protein HY422_02220 [Candidatus Komeilibacteria bacterium]|nr:hypothetical protein [Candidatus Komeilibacteria bacterium]
MPYRYQEGLTFLELIIVLTLIGMLVVLTINLFTRYQANQMLRLTEEEIKSTIVEARRNARVGVNGSKHGIYFDSANGAYTLFSGEDFAHRNVQYDFIHTWNKGLVTYQGPSEMVFSALKATTSPVTIQLTDSTGKQRVININELGSIQ